MSYILDALKKAESERNPGTLSAPTAPSAFGPFPQGPAKRRKPWLWIALPALTLGLLGAAWLGAMQSWTPPAAQPPTPQPAARQAALPATNGETQLTSAGPPERSVGREPTRKQVKPKERPAPKTLVKKQPPAKDLPKAAKAPPPSPEASIATLRELPAQIQREIPVFVVGGYIYSGNKADRSILINKRLLREGDEVAPGLKLEKMMRNGIVLNYKGYRYRTSY